MATDTTPARTAPKHLNLVALTPTDVPAQQAQLEDWCTRTLHEVGVDLRDCHDNMRIACDHGWAMTNLSRLEKRLKDRITYLEKIRAAVREGYLIVPNFDVEVMAVRVRASRQQHASRSDHSDYGEPTSGGLHPVRADLLPVGEGEYVDDAFLTSECRSQTTLQDGKTIRKYVFTESAGYDAPDFPVLAVKPLVMEATARAMALRIFDRIGVVTGKREDPIVVGQIIDPRQRGSKWDGPKVVSFFVAWWFDTRVL